MIMRHLSDEKGVALVVVLAIVVLSTAMLAVVLYFIQKGTETSGLERKYQTAKDASLGAVDVFTKEILPTALYQAITVPGSSLTNTLGQFSATASARIDAATTDSCFSEKLTKSTSAWSTGCDSSTNPKTAPDIVFTLESNNAQPFRVYAKIVDTVKGNSNTSPNPPLDNTDGAASPGSQPYMYSMEVQGERQNNPSERASFEVLFAY
jgi:hypothetical protein